MGRQLPSSRAWRMAGQFERANSAESSMRIPSMSGAPLIGLHPLPCPSHVLAVQYPLHQIVAQDWLHGTTPKRFFPSRVQRRLRVVHGSALASHVRPFTATPSRMSRLVWPLLTSAQSRQALPHGASRSRKERRRHPNPRCVPPLRHRTDAVVQSRKRKRCLRPSAHTV